MRDMLRDALLLLGAALVALGAGMIYVPAGVITAGASLIALSVLDGYDDTPDGGSDEQT